MQMSKRFSIKVLVQLFFDLQYVYDRFFPVYMSQREHLSRYVEAGNQLNKFIKHRKGGRIDGLNLTNFFSISSIGTVRN